SDPHPDGGRRASAPPSRAFASPTAAVIRARKSGSVERCSVTQDRDTLARSAAIVWFPVSASARKNASRRAALIFLDMMPPFTHPLVPSEVEGRVFPSEAIQIWHEQGCRKA